MQANKKDNYIIGKSNLELFEVKRTDTKYYVKMNKLLSNEDFYVDGFIIIIELKPNDLGQYSGLVCIEPEGCDVIFSSTIDQCFFHCQIAMVNGGWTDKILDLPLPTDVMIKK